LVNNPVKFLESYFFNL